MPNSTPYPSISHLGHHAHSHARSNNPLVNYELTGEIRWLDVPLERVVLGVQQTDGHAGAFCGRDVTLDLEPARVYGGRLETLTPGTRIHVKLRLPRDLGGELPDLPSAHSVTVLPGD
ncbi:hypothetical protein FSW04_21320 [Baekduia soli]|uniref:Uncharacterized protein n=1 Tax=Baekduia soli TaxID=496014 RepID=A0A5B8U9Z0_9ACTN|nr:hypothetical protein [Baekduia soli]QEC49855.1 hypothetical protein FSW04_21320 [Baekduia soli]